ncbi:MAG: 16S rRNA (guanine(966)-N(2))-methyltransferase RsmD [Clostridia bacterium]|nr:16S rRNA (guanine(966)-N(2))-methyltransferase RsmD [Clostridia bacterium]
MRIISGEHRGLKLCEFEGEDIRPTSDRVKESLYAILGPVKDCLVLDLFCGSGSLGLEAVSRGAKKVVFNDSSKDSLALLKKNIARFKAPIPAEVKNLDYMECLSARTRYDVIFLDPPYKTELGLKALQTIGKRGLLNRDGVAVYERNCPYEGAVKGLTKIDERKYGKTYITFFKRTEDVEAKEAGEAAPDASALVANETEQ